MPKNAWIPRSMKAFDQNPEKYLAEEKKWVLKQEISDYQ